MDKLRGTMTKKLYLRLMLYPIILIILSSALITIYHIYQFNMHEKEAIEVFSKKYILNKKKIVYSKVQSTATNIQIMQELYENKTKIKSNIKKEEIINQILLNLKNIEKNNTSNLFIVKLNNIKGGKDFAKVIFSNNNKNMIGKLISDNTPDTKYRKDILNKLKKNGEVYHNACSLTDNLMKSNSKHIYIFYYKPLNLVIGSGFYLKELDSHINEIKNREKKKIHIEIVSTLIVTLILVVLLLILSYIVTSRIAKIITKNETRINELNNNLQEKVNLQVEELRSKDLILSQKSKAQSLGEMLTLITHQWRQPLNVVNSITAKIYKDCKLNTLNKMEIEENIAQIEELTYYMSQTMTDFSTFYKPSKNEEYFKLNDIVRNTLNILFPKYYKDIKPDIKFTYEEEITLYGYKSQMQQILLSILNNSIENFNIINKEDPKIFISIIKKDNIALINIKDNGGGIKEIDLNKVFDLYYSTKEDTISRGIGLYIAKMMSKACLNGNLTVDNAEEGAIFTITCGIDAKV